jgi:hypothetical protein
MVLVKLNCSSKRITWIDKTRIDPNPLFDNYSKYNDAYHAHDMSRMYSSDSSIAFRSDIAPVSTMASSSKKRRYD